MHHMWVPDPDARRLESHPIKSDRTPSPPEPSAYRRADPLDSFPSLARNPRVLLSVEDASSKSVGARQIRYAINKRLGVHDTMGLSLASASTGGRLDEHGTERLYSAPRFAPRPALAFQLLQGLVGALLQFVLQLLRLLLLYEDFRIGRRAFIGLGEIDQR